MTYEEALHKLHILGPELASRPGEPARKFTLDAMRTLLAALDHPERRFPSVLVAGTNGKGSTAATLAAIAASAGLRTGLYTSPHLLRVNERIRTATPGDASPSTADPRAASPATSLLPDIDDATFAALFTRADHTAEALVAAGSLPHYPSFFELLTAVAFLHFAEARIELAVLEVGLGGRLDATNTVEPILSIITDIGMDHMDFLGHTLGEIAREKAGILRLDGVLVTLSQHPEANATIGEAAVARNVRGVDAARCLPPTRQFFAPEPQAAGWLPRNRYQLAIDGETLTIDSPLRGPHQQRNIALAIAAAIELRSNHGFAIPNTAIEAGVRATVWPGRLELILPATESGPPGSAVASPSGDAVHHPGAPLPALRIPLLLDVAHNPAGAWTLRAAIAQLPQARPRTLLFSCLADKAIDEIAQVLLPLFDSSSADPDRARDHVVLAPIQNPRAATIEQLLAAAHALDVPAHAAPHVPAALAQAVAMTPADGIIIATGSIYLIGELRALALSTP